MISQVSGAVMGRQFAYWLVHEHMIVYITDQAESAMRARSTSVHVVMIPST